ncbi:unnamed protein product, partial [Linum tenue]
SSSSLQDLSSLVSSALHCLVLKGFQISRETNKEKPQGVSQSRRQLPQKIQPGSVKLKKWLPRRIWTRCSSARTTAISGTTILSTPFRLTLHLIGVVPFSRLSDCCLALWCGPCVSYLLRKRALYNDMSRYVCCAGYMPCSGRCGESKCPEFCLCTEVLVRE